MCDSNFLPSAGLSYWKIGTRQICMKWLLIIRHVNSVKQCQTVSTVSTVIARCYLHLRWYFWQQYMIDLNSQAARSLYFKFKFTFLLFPEPNLKTLLGWARKLKCWDFPECRIENKPKWANIVLLQEIENRTVESPAIVMLILWLSARLTINGNIKEILKLNKT